MSSQLLVIVVFFVACIYMYMYLYSVRVPSEYIVHVLNCIVNQPTFSLYCLIVFSYLQFVRDLQRSPSAKCLSLHKHFFKPFDFMLRACTFIKHSSLTCISLITFEFELSSLNLSPYHFLHNLFLPLMICSCRCYNKESCSSVVMISWIPLVQVSSLPYLYMSIGICCLVIYIVFSNNGITMLILPKRQIMISQLVYYCVC